MYSITVKLTMVPFENEIQFLAAIVRLYYDRQLQSQDLF